MDSQTLMLFGGIGAILVLASLIGLILKLRTRGSPNAVIDNLNARINAWWVMVVVIGIAFWLGTGAVILLFYAVSFYALREFLTLTPTRRSDYPALVAAFYLALPLQYLLIYADRYRLFSIFIPVYVFLLLPILASLGGDSTHFLERASKVQWGQCTAPSLQIAPSPMHGPPQSLGTAARRTAPGARGDQQRSAHLPRKLHKAIKISCLLLKANNGVADAAGSRHGVGHEHGWAVLRCSSTACRAAGRAQCPTAPRPHANVPASVCGTWRAPNAVPAYVRRSPSAHSCLPRGM